MTSAQIMGILADQGIAIAASDDGTRIRFLGQAVVPKRVKHLVVSHKRQLLAHLWLKGQKPNHESAKSSRRRRSVSDRRRIDEARKSVEIADKLKRYRASSREAQAGSCCAADCTRRDDVHKQPCDSSAAERNRESQLLHCSPEGEVRAASR